MNLKKYSIIDDETKHLINGYIRNIQQTLSRLNNFYVININQICALYYFIQYDKWNMKWKTKQWQISGDTISTPSTGFFGWQSIFLTNIVHQGQHDWKFKIKEDNDTIIIGIWNMQNDPMNLVVADFDYLGKTESTAYAFDVDRAELNIHDARNQWTGRNSYGVACKKGSIIEMHLDLDNLQLSFTIDNKYYGKAFDIKKAKYIACISCYSNDNILQLLSYNQR